ncbi:Uncharacterised protein [Vibrio cholerae]|nr:Uncharacterised protein [Vibrio cholerae]CSI59880.1 Uncharacterised protein [Vibrio cholerae]CSI74659.1 Uncharacterised protein [Vibrio cholerae]
MLFDRGKQVIQILVTRYACTTEIKFVIILFTERRQLIIE